ncbi:hypothetical protein GLOTRDRAFT_95200 [Gloeophyllum trabeum ATCC 11539]|uniref:Transcription regulator Rua1 C-terminal domain-containing protein n=1 Tax=Gloeophyllum trabeum (strain ATCC 11539 / FP-39264 / Madison 617) TaxID=670483 RepID=S7Q101_GLOTA|nr:uncharacterized protein GLOTRDRAFT_95200 [Gloeophyllum trabeum ATCC 11539]EPQ53192.1 hypothetical protein GLOTRDRAFT_95200 [Gloeophyllum trabeum ATCC 11539]
MPSLSVLNHRGSEGPAKTYPQRTFPAHVPINAAFPLFYRRFPVSSFFLLPNQAPSWSAHVEGTFQPPADPLDLYTPRFVKGVGRTKMGLCPVCCEEGEKRWFFMKTSISPTTTRPFSPPVAFRTRAREGAAPKERTRVVEGRCHKCRRWVALEGVKDVVLKVKEIYWWKHAAACHRGSGIEGEGGWFVEDDTWRAVDQAEGV